MRHVRNIVAVLAAAIASVVIVPGCGNGSHSSPSSTTASARKTTPTTSTASTATTASAVTATSAAGPAGNTESPMCTATDVEWQTVGSDFSGSTSGLAGARDMMALGQDLLGLAGQQPDTATGVTLVSGSQLFIQNSLAVSSGGSVDSSMQAAQTLQAVRAVLVQECGLSGSPASPTVPSTATAPTVSTAASTGGGDPIATLNTYWQSIASHQYSAAYAELVPGSLGLTESQFVVGEQQSGVQSASFSGHVSHNDGSVATVDVDSLTTHDRQFGCRSWAGSYQLSHRSGRWLIARASISPSSCG